MPRFNIDTWRKDFHDREIQPEELSTLIKPGSNIFIGTGCSEPLILTKELVHHKWQWADCKLFHFLTLSNQKYFSKENPTSFRHNTFSIIGSAQIREAVNSGLSDFTPVKTSEIPVLLRKGIILIDVALIQISPPDQHGFCSLGINVDIIKAVIEVAKTIIAQINPKMPYTNGNTLIKLRKVSHFIYQDTPLLSYENKASKQEEGVIQRIGSYFSRLINDGTTLNIGLGKIPPRCWEFLSEKKDLAIYSEVVVLTKKLIECVESDVINCEKNTYPHIMTSFVLGPSKLYNYINQNAFFEIHPTEFINNIRNIAKNVKICSIYSAIAVDLTGQITNHLHNQFYSGIGGEHDFIQGTSIAEGGKTIIVLQSIAKNGKISRIVPIVEQSSIPACDVHYVITEWGIAQLGGKSIRERALQLIGIAHPKFRKELIKEAKKLHYIYEDQLLPSSVDGIVAVYPEKYESKFQTKSKGMISIRPVKFTDESLIQHLYYHLKPHDRLLRFLSPRKIFPHKETQILINVDYTKTFMLIALTGRDETQEIIGAGSYCVVPGGNNMAEIAVTIDANWQHQGIGTYFFEKMIEIAQENQILGLCGDYMSENSAITAILKHLPYRISFEYYETIISFSFRFADKVDHSKNHLNIQDPFMEYKVNL
ncbi:MAG: GNAT family N-acetyltransferase [Promethearchaeota archaeon]